MSNNIEIQQGNNSKKNINRAQQVSKEGSDFKKQTVSIVDIDTAIMSYLEKINLHIISNDIKKSVPVMYASPEKWQRIKENGYFKDQKGQIQLPLVVFSRNNLADDDTLNRKFNKHERISYTTGYSKKNKYDKFSKQVGLKPTQDLYKVRVGDHVVIDYEFIIWTEYVSHTNQIIEQLNWNSNEYWGVDDKRKFRSTIDSFTTELDNTTDADRLVRTTFTLNVKGYLLPDSIEDSELDEQMIKEYTTQKVVLMEEIETGLSDITSLDELDKYITNTKK